MRSLLREMDSKFLELENKCDCDESNCLECNPEEIEEQNVTAAVAGFNTPKAFAKKTNNETAEQLGYKKVQEAMDKK